MEKIITMGVVKNGVIVPNIPLPEGAWVEIQVQGVSRQFTPEEQAEFDAWSQASNNALELVERLAAEMTPDEKTR
jgi:hypothetical protein